MGINIQIDASRDKESSSVKASGSVQHVITDKEASTFKVTDSSLKKAVKAYFGKSPNDAYLHSPTPWGDLYKTYDWEQVNTLLEVQRAEILNITSEPVIVKTQEFENKSSVPGVFNVSISDSVTNSASSSWSTSNTVSFSQKVEYGISFLGAGVKGETGMSYSHTWGEAGSETKSNTIGSSSGLSVTLQPGQSVKAELTASKGVMKVRVTYLVYLIGGTAVNYNPTYKGHHFWYLPIGGVMSKGNLPNQLLITEDIEIGYYSNSKIVLTDMALDQVIEEHRLVDVAGA